MKITATTYAPDRAAWRAWLSEHGSSEREIWLIFYKKGSGQPSPSYDEAVEEALCFGWIDGVKQSLDAERYVQRFTPRLPSSQWSASNRRRVQRLASEGRMTPAGMALLPPDWQEEPVERAHPEQAEIPAFIQEALSAAGQEEALAQLPASLRRAYLNYILDAKREETRLKRLAFVLDHLARGERIDFMKPLR